VGKERKFEFVPFGVGDECCVVVFCLPLLFQALIGIDFLYFSPLAGFQYDRRMINSFRLPVLALGAAMVFLSFVASAQETNTMPPMVATLTGNAATNPVPRDPKWVKRHEEFVKIAQAGGVDLLFLGDSITDFWRNRGAKVWNSYYGGRHAANFGISGDRTEHVLWRIDQGELDGIKPKVVVLMIGTNNTGKEKDGKPRSSNGETIQGVQAVVARIREKLPDTKILLLAIFPRGTFDNPQRAQVALINTVIAKLDDGNMVRFLDIGPKFLESDGTLPTSIMPDLLHPNAHGYQIWADAIEPTLAEMLK
jgi:lysophospholipase L1-like esterase